MNDTVVQKKDKIKTFKKIKVSDRDDINVVKVTLKEMGFCTDQQLGAVLGRATDMGLDRLDIEELKAFRIAYSEQKTNEYLFALVVHNECNLWLVETHYLGELNLTPNNSKHDSVFGLDEIFCFKNVSAD